METPEKGMKIRNFISQTNAVIVVGYPKTGSHLIMSILAELGKFIRYNNLSSSFSRFLVWRFFKLTIINEPFRALSEVIQKTEKEIH